ncbi:MAG: uracil-DNA glycosylase [Eubacteriales bacterium]|jgi:DNA polymerase|nr:uracil-DNA glycosylase [Eubacteriales bacterium]
MADLSWENIEQQITNCRRCRLYQQRNHIVLGEGNRSADIMLIGEGPGADEDAIGRPFVGKAGHLLDKMFSAIDIKREELYITNVVKCRPPGNRTPLDEEAEACLPILRMQYALIIPKIVVCLGATATRYVYDRDARITRVRGQWLDKNGTLFMPTYHPAALLRDESKKKDAWQDMQSIAKTYAVLRQEK